MKAAVLHGFSQSPRCEDFAEPVPVDGEALVHVHAASLKAVEKQLAKGSHYASKSEFPFVCGVDGVGHLDDGRRVFFGGCRPPYGSMAERTVVPRAFTFPVSDALSDEVAAAIPNPGVSAWLALSFQGGLVKGENVLILGATGVAGKLAVRIARLLGAARVVAAGRNPQALASLRENGADATIQLEKASTELEADFRREAGDTGYQVIIDYLWGRPTEALLAALTQKEFLAMSSRTRLVQVGETAGPTIELPAAVLRSTALTICGTAGIPAPEVLRNTLQQVLALAASGELHIDTERVPLSEIQHAWERGEPGRRMVIVP